MNILFITNNFPPIVDGVGDYTYHLAKEFSSKGHNVFVVCRKNNIIKSIDNIKVYPIIDKWNSSAILPIINIISDNSIDVVSLQYVPHAFQKKGLPYKLIPILHAINKRTNAKIFTFCHEVTVEAENFNLKRLLLSFLMSKITKQVVKSSTWVSTSIDYYKAMIEEMDASKKIITIPISSNVPSVNITDSELHQLRSKIAPNNEIIVSFFGVRNITTSLKAIEMLIGEGYRIRPLLIGKTSKNNSVPESLNAYITGVLELNQIDKYFKITDIMILPESNSFGCSFKSGSLMAALRNSLLVVTSKGKATSLKLEHMENIVFTDFTNEQTIASALRILINSNQIRTYIGQNAKIITNCFSWENTYNDYIRICGY